MNHRVASVLACALFVTALTGCSSRMAAGPVRLDPASGSDQARTAAARSALIAALHSGNAADAAARLAPGVELTGVADVHRGREAVLVELVGLAEHARPHGLGFDLGRTRYCTGALHDIGMFVAGGQGGAAARQLWNAELLWRPTAAGELELHSVSLHLPKDFSAYRSRPCRAPGDSVFTAKRMTLLVEPGSTSWSDASYGPDIESALQSAGWRPSFVRRGEHLNTRTKLNRVGLRVQLTGPVYAELGGRWLGGEIVRRHPDESNVAFEYDAAAGSIAAGIRHGWLHGSAGVSYLRLAGKWRTVDPRPGSVGTQPAVWNAWTVGPAAEIGVLVPLVARAGVDITARFNRFPAAGVVGYRGSDPASIDFSHKGVGAALALRF